MLRRESLDNPSSHAGRIEQAAVLENAFLLQLRDVGRHRVGRRESEVTLDLHVRRWAAFLAPVLRDVGQDFLLLRCGSLGITPIATVPVDFCQAAFFAVVEPGHANSRWAESALSRF